MIRFGCPKCQTPLQASTEQAEVDVCCPLCKTQMRVPSQASINSAASQSAARPPAPPDTRTAQTRPAGLSGRASDQSTAPTEMFSASWYFQRGGKKYGPFSTTQFTQLVQSGKLQSTDSVWKEGMSKWKLVSEVKREFDVPPRSRTKVASESPPLPPSKAGSGFGALAESDSPRKDRTGKNQPGFAPKTKYLLIAALVAGLLVLSGLTVFLLVGKPSRTPQGRERTENKGAGAQGERKEKVAEPLGGQRDRTVRAPDFSKADYSLPDFSKVDYGVPDFSKLDYTKGPNGEKLVTQVNDQLVYALGIRGAGNRFTLHGRAYLPTPDGKVKAEWHYFNGKQHGITTEWYDNGQKSLEGAMRENTKVGKWKSWHRNGKPKIEEWYLDGVLHGPISHWHDNGQKEEESACVQGKEHGAVRLWHSNGQLRLEEWFVHGLAHGTRKEWYANGKLNVKAAYMNGKLEGTYLEWDEQGDVVLQVDFQGGNAVGFDHHKVRRLGVIRMMFIMCDERRGGGNFPGYGSAIPCFRGEARFFKVIGRPDSGYREGNPLQAREQTWVYRCSDGPLQLEVYTVPQALVNVRKMKDN